MKANFFYLIIGIVSGLAIAYFFFHSCNRPAEVVTGKDSLIAVHDTIQGKPVVIHETKPVFIQKDNVVTVTEVIYKDGKRDTIYKPVDTTKFNPDYYVVREYADTFPILIDTVNYGNIYTTANVSENKLNLHNAFADLHFPAQKTVVEKKGFFYFGFEGFGNRSGFTGAGVNFSYKAKNNKIFELGAVKLNEVQYKAGLKIPL